MICGDVLARPRSPAVELVTDRSWGYAVGGDAGARPLLDDRLRMAPVRGDAEQAPDELLAALIASLARTHQGEERVCDEGQG